MLTGGQSTRNFGSFTKQRLDRKNSRLTDQFKHTTSEHTVKKVSLTLIKKVVLLDCIYYKSSITELL